MLIAKDLAIKCLLGASVCAAGGGFGIYYNKNIRNRPAKKPESEADWIKSVGLDCGGTFNNAGADCTITSGKLKVKHDETKKGDGLSSGSTQSSPAGKVKVYKLSGTNSGYNKNFKFVVESGDIALTAPTGVTSQVTKLEEFETYEIKEDTGKNLYLTIKEKADDEKKRMLGLKDSGCDLPTDSTDKTCTLDSAKLNALNFEGKEKQQATITSPATLQLTISKTTDNTSFPLGYKFVFKSTGGDSTIPGANSQSTTLKDGTNFDFKVKKNGTSLTLEKAWDLNSLAAKVGLENCNGSSNECSIKGGSFNIKQGESDKETDKSKASTNAGNGKIKVYQSDDGKGHENGFKFVIEEGDISLNNGSNKKLEEFETYEITEDAGKYYLTRKTKAVDEIKKALGLPNKCEFPTDTNPKDCSDVSVEDLKKVNFDGKKEGGNVTIADSKNATLKITKTSDSSLYPLGYKFIFSSEKDISIDKTGNNNEKITVKPSTNTEFKIKKQNKTLTLEKAWTVKALGEKAGLNCPEPSDTNKECTLTENKVNVFNESNTKIDGAKVKNGASGSSDKKVKYELDQDGYNQGIKFSVTEDIELEKNGGSSDPAVKILKGNGSDTSYEIKEHESKWYLYKKSSGAGA